MPLLHLVCSPLQCRFTLMLELDTDSRTDLCSQVHYCTRRSKARYPSQQASLCQHRIKHTLHPERHPTHQVFRLDAVQHRGNVLSSIFLQMRTKCQMLSCFQNTRDESLGQDQAVTHSLMRTPGINIAATGLDMNGLSVADVPSRSGECPMHSIPDSPP